MQRALELGRRLAGDVFVVAIAAGALAEFFAARDDFSTWAPRGELHVAIPGLLALSLPLLLRRRLPLGAPLFVYAAAAGVSLVEGHLVSYMFTSVVALGTATFFAAYLNERRNALLALPALYAMVTVVNYVDPDGSFGDWVFPVVILTGAWVAGLSLNVRLAHARERERVALERAELARNEVLEERRRIARELHDVVAHSVSVMTVQAAGVRRLLRDDQAREREALETIERTGRDALAEMRRVLGVLRGADEEASRAPQPGLASLAGLIAQVRDAGVPVAYAVKGTPRELPPGVDLAAYRVVQEALTNTLRHAGPATAEVVVRWAGDVLELEVSNDGRSERNGDGTGNGLAGMRERVSLYGGSVEEGPRPGGGYRVRARLPLGGAA